MTGTLEIEMKIKIEEDFQFWMRKLTAFSFSLISEELHQDTYFDSKTRKLKEKGITLRLRRVEDSTYLTIKKPVTGGSSSLTKNKKEFQQQISNKKEIKEMLSFFEFAPSIIVKKRRWTFKKSENESKSVSICLDLVDDLGLFLELEYLCQKEEKEQAEEELSLLIDSLSLDKKDSTNKSYPELLSLQKRTNDY